MVSNLILVMCLATQPVAGLGETVKTDCYCTDKVGARHELGDVICIRFPDRAYLARCEMSLNNPMWREVFEGCDISLLRERVYRL